jgi:hypothetical protein
MAHTAQANAFRPFAVKLAARPSVPVVIPHCTASKLRPPASGKYSPRCAKAWMCLRPDACLGITRALSPPGSHELGSRARAYITAHFSASPSLISNWTSCAPGCVAGHASSGCGWRSTPQAKLIPVLQLGPRTQNAAHVLIHTLRQQLAPTCLPVFTSDGLNLSFYAAPSPFWGMGKGQGTTSTPLAGGIRTNLWPGQEGLSALPTGARDPADALWDSGGAAERPQPTRAEWAAQYGLHRTREPNPATKRFRFDPPQLVDSEAPATAPAPSRMVAGLLSLRLPA